MIAEAESAGTDPTLRHVREAIRSRFVVDRQGFATLLVAVILFFAVRHRFGISPALALSTGLWCAYCVAHLSFRLADRAALVWRSARSAVVFGATVLSASALAGRGVEAFLWSLPDLSLSEQAVRYGWHLAFVTALVAMPIVRSVGSARKLARSEAQRAQLSARLLALQAQIEPHFLFNTLAALRSLIRRDSRAAAVLLDRMTEFLRAVLPDARQTTSTLAREAAIVEAYLAIMQSRLSDRLQYSIDLAPAALNVELPPLLVQPLVENALKHGIEPCESGGIVAMTARLEGDTIVIVVRNTGNGLRRDTARPRSGEDRPHTGLDNIRSRIDALHAGGGSLTLGSDADGATLATLRLPFSE